MRDNGQIEGVGQWKDGKSDGLTIWWYPNGQKRSEDIYKDGKLLTAIGWKPNGEKCPHTNVVDGNGVWVKYHDDGREYGHATYKDGERVRD